ncbi:MAG TPA: signal peptidase I [Candidatus Limiplasma sp.]|nr:signal peptidase I [Candidatus Limiplasma sp.]
MQTGKDFYTSREEAEALLRETLEGKDNKDADKAVKGSAKWMKYIRRFLYFLIIAAMLTMLGKVWYQKLHDEIPSLFGYQLYVVETGSMLPTLPIGTNILARQLRPNDELKVGDVVTYSHETAAVTHRIIELVPGEDGILRYQTKGDNPDNSKDPWLVEREDVRGIVVWHFSLSSLFGK